MKQTIKTQILTWLETESQSSFTMEEVAKGINLVKAEDFKLLVQTIAAMEREQLVEFTKKGKIKLAQKDILIECIFRANERGFGFVTIDSDEDDVFIPKESTSYALNGDKVAIDIVKPANLVQGKTAEGKVVDIIEREFTQIIGEFVAYTEEMVQETDLYGELIPKDKKLKNYQIYVAAEGIKPVEGMICLLEITHYPEPGYNTQIEGLIKQTVGHKNDPGMDIMSIVMQYGIPTEFPREVIEQGEKTPDEISARDLEGRKDLRNQTIVTIDGADAKDLDDAVTVRKLDNGHYFLGVHIADVSYYVPEGSPIDLEAYERGTSVYLTDRVIPMIPHRLSNGICSLNPHVPRLTMSCEMEIDQAGKVVRHDIFPSVIQTSARMTYTAVNQILEEKNPEVMAEYSELVPMFQAMKELHHILEEMRQRRGAISFEDRESYILVDEAGHPQDIILRERGVGERLIESFMLAANETVAAHFYQLDLPFIYRIHEQPNEDKMQRFFEFASTFGILVKGTKEDITPRQLQDALDKVAGKPEEMVINTMLLRSMQQARYSEQLDSHYGLAAPYYTHFTSPIRRYPDLIVHRLIRFYLTQTVDKKGKDKWKELLPDIAKHSSQMERRSVEAERETEAMKKAEFMEDKIGEEYDGIISSIMKFGMFVELTNTVEGLVHMKSMTDDYYHYLENHLALVGERTGKTYKIGQPVRIKVTKADADLREIDFELVSAETTHELAHVVNGSHNRQSRRRKNKGNHQTSSLKSSSTKSVKEKTEKKKAKGKKKKQPFYKGVAKKKSHKKK